MVTATIIEFPNSAQAPVFQQSRHDDNVREMAELTEARAIRRGKESTFECAVTGVRFAFAHMDRERHERQF